LFKDERLSISNVTEQKINTFFGNPFVRLMNWTDQDIQALITKNILVEFVSGTQHILGELT